MTREKILDTIRRELHRQSMASPRDLKIGPADRPDDMVLHGVVDLLALAEAIRDE